MKDGFKKRNQCTDRYDYHRRADHRNGEKRKHEIARFRWVGCLPHEARYFARRLEGIFFVQSKIVRRLMQDVIETRRLPSPAPRPQALASDGQNLWMGSIETSRLYHIDPVHWTVIEEAAVPGKPWGVAVVGNELRVVCGEGENDDRYIRRFIPGHGFKSERIPCPDYTGSQLSFDGERLFLSQWYNKRIVPMNGSFEESASITLAHQICGQVIANGKHYALTTDDEMSRDYWITLIDRKLGTQEDLARVPFAARALAFDGRQFWTNHREQHEMVAFQLPH